MKTVTEAMDEPVPPAAEETLAHLRACQERLAGMRSDDAAKEFLDEMATRFAAERPGLAEYLRTQIARLGEGDEVRHAVRHGVPQIALLREQVLGRLRREEELLLAEIGEAPPEIEVVPLLRLAAGAMGVSAGVAVWFGLWISGVDAPWSPLAGAVTAVIVHARVLKGMRRRLDRSGRS